MVKRTESMIQRAVMDYLSTVKDIYFFRAGSGAFQTMQGRYVKTGRPGVPDIVCLFGGRWIGLEIKTDTGRQSKDQKKAEADIKTAGGEYYIIRSVPAARKVVEGGN